MDGTGDHVKLSKPGSERQRLNVFSHMYRIDSKDKLVHKYKHDHINIHMCAYMYMCVYLYTQHKQNMFPIFKYISVGRRPIETH
jgi:hypothetical protein